jgi:hypothetical protein
VKQLGLPTLISAEELSQGQYDEQSMMTFLSFLQTLDGKNGTYSFLSSSLTISISS